MASRFTPAGFLFRQFAIEPTMRRCPTVAHVTLDETVWRSLRMALRWFHRYYEVATARSRPRVMRIPGCGMPTTATLAIRAFP
jgi:hypothetical protein